MSFINIFDEAYVPYTKDDDMKSERHHTHIFDTFRRDSGTVECQRCGHEIEIGALPYALLAGSRATPEAKDLLERTRGRGEL